MTKEEKYKNLDRINFWTSNCDSKASFILTIQGVVLSIIFTSSYSSAIVETISRHFTFTHIKLKSVINFVEGLCLILFFIFILLSLYHIYKTLTARLNPKVFKQPGLITNSLLFFDTISKRTFQKFQSDISNSDDQKIENDIDSQVYINSKICSIKFLHFNKTLKFNVYAFLAGLAYIIIRAKINGG